MPKRISRTVHLLPQFQVEKSAVRARRDRYKRKEAKEEEKEAEGIKETGEYRVPSMYALSRPLSPPPPPRRRGRRFYYRSLLMHTALRYSFAV